MILLALALSAAPPAQRPDLLVEDFEGQTYGLWRVEGEAFGKGPARGTLPNQMPVTGYLGKGLVNSFHKGDASTGKLTSPPVRMSRRYVNFLIGGGGYAGKTCMNLVLDGKVVRTATGPNTEPGGSERLDWHTWDVSEFAGKEVVFQIVDDHTGGWGHVNVDHIVQSDRRKQAAPASRDFVVKGRYLHLPVRTGGTKTRMKFVVDGEVVREFEIELADDSRRSFWAFADVSAYAGKKLTVSVDRPPAESKGLDAITQGDELKGDALYQEKGRPQFHFTSRRGWLNDPNGLVYHKGEWHLYYQHNPYGWSWGNMHWGHAVSKDLLHWREEPIALYPRKFGDWAFSGSAAVDKANTSGFRRGKEDVLVLAYTSTGRGECIAFSNDRGRTWTEYEGNPVVRHQGRDPRLLWHAPSKRWVMAVYDEAQRKQWVAFHSSADLKKWKYESRIEGFYECPDLFELPIEGEAKKTKWVLYAADGLYVLGDFDGKTFTAETKKLRTWHGNFYAAQTFSDAPDGRRVQIGWANGVSFPDMPFNQQMTIPCQLTLRKTADGVRMFAYPVKEVDSLGEKAFSLKGGKVGKGEDPLAKVKGELLDVRAEIEPPKEGGFAFDLRGVAVRYDAVKGQLYAGKLAMPLKPIDGKVRLRLLLDRGSLEAFGNDGRVALSLAVRPSADNRSLSLTAFGGEAKVASLEVYEVRSAWAKR
jgi:fructan beta-fructosidase